jgi:osmotically-inducible protein OsmY
MKKTALAIFLTSALLGLSGCASTGQFFDEASTTAKVKKAIYSEPSLKVMDISVSTEGGVVELNGTVKSRAERAKAAQVAARVEGVKKVNNQLKVVSQ